MKQNYKQKIQNKVKKRKLDRKEGIKSGKIEDFVKTTRNSSKQNAIDLLRWPLLSASPILTF